VDELRFPGRKARPEDFTPTALSKWLESNENPDIKYSDAPLMYQVADTFYDHYFGGLKDADGATISNKISPEEMRTFEATMIESILRAADSEFQFTVHVSPGSGFRVASFKEGNEHVISFSDQTTLAIIRPLKYWVVMMAPHQLGYLESANNFFSQRKQLSRSICEGVDRFFTSMAKSGLAASPRIRLRYSGTGLSGFVTYAADYVLAMHETYHITSPERPGRSSNDEEVEADCFALRRLKETDDSGYLELLDHFQTGKAPTAEFEARPLLRSGLEIPPISDKAPWPAALFAYVRVINELCESGGEAEVSRSTMHRIRDVVEATYDDPAVVDSLWEDVTNPQTLPGFYLTRAWKYFLDEPDGSRINALRSTATALRTNLRLARENRRNHTT
jgi:hypothetical protein